MNVSAVNCTPIKPQVAFGNEKELDYNNIKTVTDKVNDEFCNSSNIKKPLAAVSSVLIAALLTFTGGKKVGTMLANVSKNKLPNLMKKGVYSLSVGAKKLSSNLKNDLPTKAGKLKNMASSALKKSSNGILTGYKKLAGNVKGQEGAVKAFEKMTGIVALSSVFPSVLAKDNNEDGVKDILQRGQNAYTGSSKKMDGILEKTSVVADLIDALS